MPCLMPIVQDPHPPSGHTISDSGSCPTPSKPTKQIKSLDIENYPAEPRANIRPLPQKWSNKHPTKKNLHNSLSCPQAYRAGVRRR